MGCRGLCCCSPGAAALNEDNARFVLLAAVILLYMVCGAAVFSALELPRERETQQRWQARLQNFSRRHNLSLADLRDLLWEYEVAYVAGIRVQDVRPRWDFPGAFYFVGTVVSTIGESGQPRALARWDSPPHTSSTPAQSLARRRRNSAQDRTAAVLKLLRRVGGGGHVIYM